MKTLLQINTNVGWNSTGRIAEEIGRAAIERGWLSTIAYGRNMDGAPSSASKLIKVGTKSDAIMHGIHTRLTDRHGLSSKKATTDLIKRIEEVSPDIIQLHNIHGYYLNYPLLFSYLSRTGIPVVWTLHDCWPFTGHCAYFDMADCRKWLNGCSKCPLTSMYPASLCIDNSEKNYQLKKQCFTSLDNVHIVAVSKWLKKVVEKSFLEKFPVDVIYNGIDLPDIQSNKVKREPLVLGAASKWDPRKGLDTFIALREKLPNEIRMVLIGLSASQIRSLPANIEGVARINERNALNDWYRRAAVFINPSLSETLSITNLEAQACGTPVITFNSGGMRETITPQTGVLVKPGDIDGLAKAVNRIISKDLILNPTDCYRHIEENFNKANNFRTYIDLYESILSSHAVKIPELI